MGIATTDSNTAGGGTDGNFTAFPLNTEPEKTGVHEKLFAAMATIMLLVVMPATSAIRAAESKIVSENELYQLFPGTFQVVARGVLRIDIVAKSDGSLSAKKANDSDTGRWTIQLGKLCIKFSKWLKSQLRCSAVMDDGDWYRTADVAFKKIDGVVLSSQ